MDEFSLGIFAAILREIQEAELPDLSARLLKIFDLLGKLSRYQWLARPLRTGEADVWDASRPIWLGLRNAIENHARNLDIAYYSSGAETDDITTAAKIATADNDAPEIMESLLRDLGSLLGSVRAAGEGARPAIRLIAEMAPRQTLEDELANIGFLAVKATDQRYGPGFTHKSRMALAVLLEEARKTPDGLTAKAIRLSAELAELMDGKSPDLQAEKEKPRVIDCVMEVPSLTERVSRDSVAEMDILGRFDEAHSHQEQSKFVEQLRNIGGLVVAEELTSRLSSSPEYTRCRILRALDELAIQGYVPPEDETQRAGQADKVKGVLEHLERVRRASQSSDRCGLFDKVIDDVEEYRRGIPNGDL